MPDEIAAPAAFAWAPAAEPDIAIRSGAIAGVPVIIGKDGVEKIEEVDLDEKEKKEFMHSIDAVKSLWEAASKIDTDLSK